MPLNIILSKEDIILKMNRLSFFPQKRCNISVTVIRTSKSGSSLKEAMCFFIESLIAGLSYFKAMSLSTFTHTYRIFGTGSREAIIIRLIIFSR